MREFTYTARIGTEKFTVDGTLWANDSRHAKRLVKIELSREFEVSAGQVFVLEIDGGRSLNEELCLDDSEYWT